MTHTTRPALHRPVRLALIGLLFAACASAPPDGGITVRPVPKPTPPDPAALSHFVDARLFEMRGQHERAIASLRAAISIDSTSATLYGALARNLAAKGRHSDAAAPAAAALAREGSNLDIRWIYHESLISGLKDTTAALDQLEEIVRRDPNPIKGYDRMLKIHDARGDNAAVIQTLDRISALPGLNEHAKMIAAQNYTQRGVSSKALALYTDILGGNPGRSDAWVRLASLQTEAGDTLGAARSLRRAVPNQNGRVNPRRIWRQLANIYGKKTRMDSLLSESPPDLEFQEALAGVYRSIAGRDPSQRGVHLLERSALLFNHLSRLKPDRADLFAKQGELLLGLNRPADARRAFIHAGEVDNRPEYHLGTAHTLLYEREYEAALQILEEITPRVTPKSEFYGKTILSLGNAYSALGRHGEARAVYEASMALAPENTAFPYELGETYVRDGDWEAATNVFRNLLPRVEENPVALGQTLYGLARALERSDAFEESARTFERLLSLHPNHADALNYLGYMFAERGVRLGEAENFIKRALGSDPENGAYLDSLGWVYFKMGDYRRAQEYLKRAIDNEEAEMKKLGPQDTARRRGMLENLAVIYDHAGDCALALNQFFEARAWWKLALESDPDIEHTAEKLEKLTSEHGDPEAEDADR